MKNINFKLLFLSYLWLNFGAIIVFTIVFLIFIFLGKITILILLKFLPIPFEMFLISERFFIIAMMFTPITAIAYEILILIITIEDKLMYNNRGTIYKNLGDYKNSFKDFDKAISIDNTYLSPKYNRANLFIALGEYDKAQQSLEKIVSSHPDTIEAYNSLGLIYLQKRDYQKAITNFNIVLKKDKKNMPVYANRGLAYTLSKNYTQGAADFTNWKETLKCTMRSKRY